jgi:Na+/H+-dicarboxylate symporter
VRVSLTARVLIGLFAGLALGIAASASGSDGLLAAARAIEPVGTLWINAIRMTVIPLIVASLVAGVAAAPDPSAVGRIGWRALVIFVAVLGATAAFSVIVGPLMLTGLHVDPAASDALRSGVAGSDVAARSASLPTFRQWVVDLVPQNPIKAASDGAVLPLIIFSLLLGLAITRVTGDGGAMIVRFFQGLSAAMLVLVRWVLALAPIGVFALAVPLATKLGVAAAGAVLYYIGLVVGMCIIAIAAMYPLAAVMGRVPLRVFGRAAAPAQAVAFSSRSSLAALPAMFEGAERTLRLPQSLTAFFLPLAASMYRVGAVIGQVVGVLFLAKLYGVDLATPQIATIGVTAMLTSFSVPGIPGGSILVMVPVLLAAGLPVDGVGILLGVDTIPDMFRTTTNVTGHMAAAAILGRGREAANLAVTPRAASVAEPAVSTEIIG